MRLIFTAFFATLFLYCGAMQNDTTPLEKILILNISSEEIDNNLVIHYDIFNIGQNNLSLKIENFDKYNINYIFESGFKQSELKDFDTQIINNIWSSNIILTPKNVKKDLTLAVTSSSPSLDPTENPVLIENEFTEKGNDLEQGEIEEEVAEEKGKEEILDGAKTEEEYENLCSDLSIDSIYIIKDKKKYTIIGFEISNKGKNALLTDKSNKKRGSVKIQGFFGTSKEISRGSIMATNEKLKLQKVNLIMQGETYHGEIKIDKLKKSKFTPYVLLSLDPYNVLYDCDRTNNYIGLLCD